jgi:hypothetical protein
MPSHGSTVHHHRHHPEVTMNIRVITLAAAIAGTLAGTVASAQQIPLNVNTNAAMRGDRGSDRNLRADIRRLEQVIDGLQRDRRDYGGHREQAVDLLQRARQQLDEALEYDRTHGTR